jgi:predicted nucleic acid-binding protein
MDMDESAALRLARSLNSGVFVDERSGRSIAGNLGIPVIGSAGVLLVAKHRGLISSVEPLLKAMRDQGYRFSDLLIAAVLDKAGE